MESKELITYKWNQGVYSLEDLIILTKYNNLTPEDFHDISGYNYIALAQKLQNPNEKI